MKSVRNILTLGVILSLIIIPGNFSHAQADGGVKGIFGIKFGHFGEGTIEIDGREYETAADICYGVFLDYPVIDRLLVGAAIDGAEIEYDAWGPSEEKETLLNFSVGIKGNFWTGDRRLFFRPGISGGYAILNEIFTLEDSHYITARLTGEVIYRFGKRFGVLSEMGLFWAPSGGDGEKDASTTGPILILRIGMVF